MAFARRSAPGLLSARDMGLVGCRRCARVHAPDTVRCPDCGNPLQSRDRLALQRVWAWWAAGVMFYIPANIYPMLRTDTLIYNEASTIVGGAIDLLLHGSPGVALIILIASVLIPIGKFLSIAYLALSVRRASTISPARRQALYEIVDYIGRWSMVDVFVVAILAALVQLQNVATMTPGLASLFFALSVVFTMLSAQSFDSRAIWDANTANKDMTA
jgi:paraquat-inducible protein A